MLPAHARILFKELVQGVAPLQIVGKHLEWYACSTKDGFATEDIRIFDNRVRHGILLIVRTLAVCAQNGEGHLCPFILSSARFWVYLCHAQAIPSGFPPASIFPVTASVFKSITAT